MRLIERMYFLIATTGLVVFYHYLFGISYTASLFSWSDIFRHNIVTSATISIFLINFVFNFWNYKK